MVMLLNNQLRRCSYNVHKIKIKIQIITYNVKDIYIKHRCRPPQMGDIFFVFLFPSFFFLTSSYHLEIELHWAAREDWERAVFWATKWDMTQGNKKLKDELEEVMVGEKDLKKNKKNKSWVKEGSKNGMGNGERMRVKGGR